MEQKFYTPKEAGKVLGLHPKTVIRWFNAGALPGLQIGRQYRIDALALRQSHDKKEHHA